MSNRPQVAAIQNLTQELRSFVRKHPRSLRITGSILLSVTLILFSLFALSRYPRIGQREVVRKLNTFLVAFHKGASTWSFYTLSNGSFQIGLYRLNPETQLLEVMQTPRPRLLHPLPLLRSLSEYRYGLKALNVIIHSPGDYRWLCRNYQTQNSHDYYLSLGPTGFTGVRDKVQQHLPAISLNRRTTFATAKGDVSVLRFRCDDNERPR